MSETRDYSGIWTVVGIVFAVAFLVSLFSGVQSGTRSTTSSPAPVGNPTEQRYVETRFRLEGYNANESREAANAVIKFQRAQEARRK